MPMLRARVQVMPRRRGALPLLSRAGNSFRSAGKVEGVYRSENPDWLVTRYAYAYVSEHLLQKSRPASARLTGQVFSRVCAVKLA